MEKLNGVSQFTIKAVLQAVAKHELTIEEAQKLIEQLAPREVIREVVLVETGGGCQY